MLWLKLVAAFLCSVTWLAAQSLPAGIALPVMLDSTLDVKKDKPGERIEGKTMQDVLLSSGSKIKSGSHLFGHVVAVNKAEAGGSTITVAFDRIDDHGQMIPLSVGLRALASMESVHDAQLPTGAASTYSSSDEWTTTQVGGDVVNRGRGLVASRTGIVAKYSGSGVWGKLTPGSDDACLATDGNDREQALWVFSTSACGAYGFNDLKVTQNGSTDPVGQIKLQSHKDLLVRGGSGWLLLINPAPANH